MQGSSEATVITTAHTVIQPLTCKTQLSFAEWSCTSHKKEDVHRYSSDWNRRVAFPLNHQLIYSRQPKTQHSSEQLVNLILFDFIYYFILFYLLYFILILFDIRVFCNSLAKFLQYVLRGHLEQRMTYTK
jgi:hypothetical protein